MQLRLAGNGALAVPQNTLYNQWDVEDAVPYNKMNPPDTNKYRGDFMLKNKNM